MIDRTKFLEPTPKYIKDFESYELDEVKDWYNLDLIYFTRIYDENNTDPDYSKAFNQFINEFEIKLTIIEVYEIFKDYDVISFSELGHECVTKMRERGN